MPLLICCVGLPRSGKTTWAKAFATDHCAPIVNPDSIRLAIHGQRFVAEAERFVWATAHAMVRALFLAGHELVIIDATNTMRKRRDEWKSADWQTAFQLFDASKEECLRRAAAMNDAEIAPVIERMAAQWEPLAADELQVKILGATGAFPDGALDPVHDEGELQFAIAADVKAGIVRIEFGKPVAWLGLPQEEAFELSRKLAYHAGKLK
jgi:predicted kinase